jgi:hypothetical protein
MRRLPAHANWRVRQPLLTKGLTLNAAVRQRNLDLAFITAAQTAARWVSEMIHHTGASESLVQSAPRL